MTGRNDVISTARDALEERQLIKKKENAAIKIQAFIRGNLARSCLQSTRR